MILNIFISIAFVIILINVIDVINLTKHSDYENKTYIYYFCIIMTIIMPLAYYYFINIK